MGTWGIAKDMAKLNELNLSKLSRAGMYERLKNRGSQSKGKRYTFRRATPESIATLREKLQAEYKAIKKRRITLTIVIAIPLSICFVYLLFLA